MPPYLQPRKPDANAAQKERNEYIPSFIAKKPFYVPDDAGDDYLEHQRLSSQQQQQKDSKWYERGKKLGPAATKFRKGACENCGAMTHKTKECLSRPRKQGAKWTGKDIQADEVVQDVNLGWDAKRDRWNGFEAAEYERVVEDYNELQERKKFEREREGQTKQDDAEDDEGGEDDEARYEAETDMGRSQPTSTRNLRIREDTAKYLLNLDLDSAKYDPKTRSMANPGTVQGNDSALVAEEGFMRVSGDAAEFEKAQRYAWETQERGDKNKLHLQANPTSGEVVRKKQLKEAEEKKEAQRKALLNKYGAQDSHQKNPLKDIAIEESERYVEYDDRGKIKGAPVVKGKSKYPEDVYTNNHTRVWGSWWSNFQWGYACCHSTVKNSYCTGEQGKQAFAHEQLRRTGGDMEPEEMSKAVAWKEEVGREEHVPNGVDHHGKAKSDEKGRKRVFDEMKDGMTEEMMEEYRKKRTTANDPMAAMLGKDQLVR